MMEGAPQGRMPEEMQGMPMQGRMPAGMPR